MQRVINLPDSVIANPVSLGVIVPGVFPVFIIWPNTDAKVSCLFVTLFFLFLFLLFVFITTLVLYWVEYEYYTPYFCFFCCFFYLRFKVRKSHLLIYFTIECGCKGPDKICNPDTGMCNCPANFQGRICNACQCNGNSEKCERDGTCLDCQSNTHGERCEMCKPSFYGDALKGDCKG